MGTTEKAKRLSLHDKQLILERFKDGLNGTEISAALGLSYSAVIYYLSKVKRRNGLKKAEKEIAKAEKATKGKTYRKLSQSDIDHMIDLWKSGKYTKTQIAELMGVHFSTPGHHINRWEMAQGNKPVTRDNPAKGPRKEPVKHTTKASTNMMDELKREIMQEIKHDLKEAMIRELLGK